MSDNNLPTLLINTEAKIPENFFHNENVKLTKIFNNVFSISFNEKELKYVVKFYSKKKHKIEEVLTLRELEHINGIPKLIASGSDKYLNYSILSKQAGMDLYEFTDKYGNITENQARIIAKELLTILKNIHGIDVIHGDIKPENIIFDTRSNKISLIDFEGRSTKGYRSPEQILSHLDIDSKTDIWSTGITLYYLVSGELPFDNDKETTTKELEVPNDFSDDFVDFLSCLLEVDIGLRYNAEEALNHIWIEN